MRAALLLLSWLTLHALNVNSSPCSNAPPFEQIDINSHWIPLFARQNTTTTTKTFVDFVSDTGDGFLATFSVARAIANDLTIKSSSSNSLVLPRAEALIIGGDIAYPEGTIDLLVEKFVLPFRLAFDWKREDTPELLVFERAKMSPMVDWMDPNRISTLLLHTVQTIIGNHPGSDFRRFSMKKTNAMNALRMRSSSQHSSLPSATELPLLPTILAVLGNHDAIDGGEGFQRLFLENAAIGGWAVRQNRSYWAARVNSNWAILGVHDQQAAGANPDIDPEQWHYFSQLLSSAAAANERLNIVLVVHAPFWLVQSSQHHKLGLRLRELFKDITSFGHELRLILSGDQHVFAHYTSVKKEEHCPELIISGGGGAFTHSTMHLPNTVQHDALAGCSFLLKQAYPSRMDSIVLHFDAIIAVLTRRVTLAFGTLSAVLIEYHWRQTLLESKEKDWWLLQVFLSRRAINREGQIQVIVPPRYQLWMGLALALCTLPALVQVLVSTKPALSFWLATASQSGRQFIHCIFLATTSNLNTAAECLGPLLWPWTTTTSTTAQWSLLTFAHVFSLDKVLLLLGPCLVYLGPPKKSARKWEGAIAMYIAGNRSALSVLSSSPRSNSPATTTNGTNVPRILPKSVPPDLAYSLDGQELIGLIQADYSHWEKFRVLRDKETRLVYDWLIKIVIANFALAYLQYFLFGHSGLVVLASIFASFLACLHSILHPVSSFAMVTLVTSAWALCKTWLVMGDNEVLTRVNVFSLVCFLTSLALASVHIARTLLDFIDVFDWSRWLPVRTITAAVLGSNSSSTSSNAREPLKRWSLLRRRPQHAYHHDLGALSTRMRWSLRSLLAPNRQQYFSSGFSLVWSVLLLLQKGVTLSFVFILILSCASAWFGPQVFPDDPFFSAARNEHFKHFLRMQFEAGTTTAGSLTVYPIAVNTMVRDVTTTSATMLGGGWFEVPFDVSPTGLFRFANIGAGEYDGDALRAIEIKSFV